MRVVIVGGGVVGLTSAYHLLRQGAVVTMLDADRLGSGASHGNAGWIVPADSAPVPAPGMVAQGLKWMCRRDSPLYIKPSLSPGFLRFLLGMARHCNRDDFHAGLRANIALAEHTMDILDAYRADDIDFEMHAHGLIKAFAEQATFARHCSDLEIPRRAGLDPELLTGPEVADLEPALSPSLAGGIYFPHERHVRPDSLVAGLIVRCRQLGADLREQTPVHDVRRHGRRVQAVITATGEVEGDAFLLAAGARTGPLSRLFGPILPVRPGKGYSVDYAPPPVTFRRIVDLCESYVAVTPLDGALRLAGTMEFTGWDTKVNRVRVAAIRRAPRRYFSEWDDPQPTGSAWVGARPMTPDGLPIIGRLPGADNAYIATGHGMLGVTLAPATGSAIAELIGGSPPQPALAPFAPGRFVATPNG